MVTDYFYKSKCLTEYLQQQGGVRGIEEQQDRADCIYRTRLWTMDQLIVGLGLVFMGFGDKTSIEQHQT